MLTIERDLLLHEAKAAGVSITSTPTLDAVDRRRVQVFALAGVALAGIGGILALSRSEASPLRVTSPVQALFVALAVGVLAYVADRERRLRRLTRLLIEERALSAALMQRLDEVRMLVDIAKAMNSTAGLDAILERIVTSAVSIVGGRSGALLLLDGEILHVVAAAGAGIETGQSLPIEGTAAQHVARTWEMLVTPETADRPAVAYAPVRHGSELLGVLALTAQAGHLFGDYDVRASELFAEQAACAISQTHRAQAAKWERAERDEQAAARGQVAGSVVAGIRDPLTSLTAATKMLQRQKLADSERLELAAVVSRQTDRLSKALEEILLAN